MTFLLSLLIAARRPDRCFLHVGWLACPPSFWRLARLASAFGGEPLDITKKETSQFRTLTISKPSTHIHQEVPCITPVSTYTKITLSSPQSTVAAGALALLGLGAVAPPSFMAHFTVFVLACFVGYMVIWNVTPALHTPLMSVTNAISSIIVIGALLQISSANTLIMWIAAFTILLTSINIAGGFAVTRRMLEMFRK
jgi:NAD/NADP transhydrogenase alpha subunit